MKMGFILGLLFFLGKKSYLEEMINSSLFQLFKQLLSRVVNLYNHCIFQFPML
jgi:hypothetical protein